MTAKEKQHVELLTAELSRAYWARIERMENLVFALNNGMPYDAILTTINNIGIECHFMVEELNKLDK